MSVRPPPPDYAPASCWEPVEAGPEWRPADELEARTGRCRATSRGCLGSVALVLLRGKHRTRWFYCAAHAYGRWVEDGRVYSWRRKSDETETPTWAGFPVG